MKNLFYGWFDDADQRVPTYEPPRPGVCMLCGGEPSQSDVRTHCIMPIDAYAARSYFYRTHRTCSEKCGDLSADGFILDMIQRNGD